MKMATRLEQSDRCEIITRGDHQCSQKWTMVGKHPQLKRSYRLCTTHGNKLARENKGWIVERQQTTD